MSHFAIALPVDGTGTEQKRRTSSLMRFLARRVKALGTASVLLLLTFSFVYNISFMVLPPLTTGRLTLLALTIVLFRRLLFAARRFVSANWLACLVLGFLVLYSLILYLLGRQVDSTQLSRSLNFLVYVIWGSLVFLVLLHYDLYKFTSIFALATVVQSLFIAYSYVSPEYRLWLSQMLIQGGNIPLTTSTQVPGFSNSSGALLSVIQGLGVFSALYAARLSRSFLTICFYSSVALLNMASTIVVGRTGLIMSVIFLPVFFIVGNWKQRQALVAIVGAAGLGLMVIAGSLFSTLSAFNPRTANVGEWALEFFQRGTETVFFSDFGSMPVPPLSMQTLLGTGLVLAENREANASGSDSGYVQTYYALGLLMAFAFYATMFGVCLRYVLLSRDRLLFAVLLLSMFVVEVKEPFIYKYIYPFFVISVVYMSSWQRRLCQTKLASSQEQQSAPAL